MTDASLAAAFLAGLAAVPSSPVPVSGFFGPALSRWVRRDGHLRGCTTHPGVRSGSLLGFAFAFGWTPCTGPILARVVAPGAASDAIARGVLLLAVYSA